MPSGGQERLHSRSSAVVAREVVGKVILWTDFDLPEAAVTTTFPTIPPSWPEAVAVHRTTSSSGLPIAKVNSIEASLDTLYAIVVVSMPGVWPTLPMTNAQPPAQTTAIVPMTP
jgi:hypothetical protein